MLFQYLYHNTQKQRCEIDREHEVACHHSVSRVEQTDALESDQRLGCEDHPEKNDDYAGTLEKARVDGAPIGDEGVDGADDDDHCKDQGCNSVRVIVCYTCDPEGDEGAVAHEKEGGRVPEHSAPRALRVGHLERELVSAARLRGYGRVPWRRGGGVLRSESEGSGQE